MSQSSTATTSPASEMMRLSSLKSLWSSTAACGSGIAPGNQAPSSSMSGRSSCLARFQRSTHPATWRATKPSGRPSPPSPRAAVVHPVQLRQGVDHVVGHPEAEGVVGGQGVGPGLAHHGAPAPLHDEEGGAHHLRVGAEQEGARGLGVGAVEDGQDGVLPDHVVAPRGHRPQRRAAQHQLHGLPPEPRRSGWPCLRGTGRRRWGRRPRSRGGGPAGRRRRAPRRTALRAGCGAVSTNAETTRRPPGPPACSRNPRIAAASSGAWVNSASCRAPSISTTAAPGMRAAVARCREGGTSWSRVGITQRTGRPRRPTQAPESNRAMAKPASWCSSGSRDASVSHSQAACSARHRAALHQVAVHRPRARRPRRGEPGPAAAPAAPRPPARGRATGGSPWRASTRRSTRAGCRRASAWATRPPRE